MVLELILRWIDMLTRQQICNSRCTRAPPWSGWRTRSQASWRLEYSSQTSRASTRRESLDSALRRSSGCNAFLWQNKKHDIARVVAFSFSLSLSLTVSDSEALYCQGGCCVFFFVVVFGELRSMILPGWLLRIPSNLSLATSYRSDRLHWFLSNQSW